jgi:hypothetical protein
MVNPHEIAAAQVDVSVRRRRRVVSEKPNPTKAASTPVLGSGVGTPIDEPSDEPDPVVLPKFACHTS